MNTSPRGFIDYPEKNDTSWYSEEENGLEAWVKEIELLGIPTYGTFSDLPSPGTADTIDGGSGKTQRQFAAVVADRTVYRDDGSEWQPWFGSGTSDRPLSEVHTESLDAEEVNGILKANDLDEVAEHLDTIKENTKKGAVRLAPGSYDDSHISGPIDIPPEIKYVSIDFSLAYIEFDSYSDVFLRRQRDDDISASPVDIAGPKRYRVDNVDDPGTVMDLWGIEGSRVYWPTTQGGVKAIIHEKRSGGSGHFNRVFVKGYKVRNGIIIGEEGEDRSCDRSFYYGQISDFSETAAHVTEGCNVNELFVQNETAKDGSGAIGILDRGNGTRIWNVHNQRNGGTNLQIEDESAVLQLNGYLGHIRDKIAAPPSQVHSEHQNIKTMDRWEWDIGWCDTPGDGSVDKKGYGPPYIDAGTTDGNVQSLEASNSPANGRGGMHYYTTVDLPDEDSRIDRYGVYIDSDTYAMMIRDMTGDGTWTVEISDGGTVEESVDTDVASTGETGLTVNSSRQYNHAFFVDGEMIADSSYEPNDENQWFTGSVPRLSLEVSGSPSSDRETTIWDWEAAYYNTDR